MIGIVLVCHANLGREMMLVAEHVCGPQEAARSIPIGPDDDMDARREEILKSVGEVDAGRGVVVLTDMFGGTPSNLAMSVMGKGKVEVLCGVNLPMLIKLVQVRGRATLAEAVEESAEAGRKYIKVASSVLQQ